MNNFPEQLLWVVTTNSFSPGIGLEGLYFMLGTVFNFPHPTFGLGHSWRLGTLNSSFSSSHGLNHRCFLRVSIPQWFFSGLRLPNLVPLSAGLSGWPSALVSVLAAHLLLGLDASESPWLPRVPLLSHFHHLRGEVGHVGFLFPSWGGLPSVGARI